MTNTKERKKQVTQSLQSAIATIEGLEHAIDASFFKVVECLASRKGKIIVTGIGKSGFVGMKIAATFTSLGHLATFLHPVEALHGDSGIISEGDVLLILSASGASPEIVKFTKYVEQAFDVTTVAITTREKSPLTALADFKIVFKVEDEGCPIGAAPMASTTATLVIGDLLASALTLPQHFEKTHFARLHPAGSLGLELRRVEDIMIQGKELPIVSESAVLKEVLHKMTEKRFGMAGVCDKNTKALTGVITDGDVRRFLLEHESRKGKCAKDIMTTDPKIIEKGKTLKEALASMELHKVTTLFVVEDRTREPIGTVHMHHIVQEHLI